MSLTVSLEMKGSVAWITLAGELDASTAPQFQKELNDAAAKKPTKLVLDVRDLEFMASAGVRMLVFAKQKMGPQVDLIMIAPQEPVLDTLRRTGLLNSIRVQDAYTEG